MNPGPDPHVASQPPPPGIRCGVCAPAGCALQRVMENFFPGRTCTAVGSAPSPAREAGAWWGLGMPLMLTVAGSLLATTGVPDGWNADGAGVAGACLGLATGAALMRLGRGFTSRQLQV